MQKSKFKLQKFDYSNRVNCSKLRSTALNSLKLNIKFRDLPHGTRKNLYESNATYFLGMDGR